MAVDDVDVSVEYERVVVKLPCLIGYLGAQRTWDQKEGREEGEAKSHRLAQDPAHQLVDAIERFVDLIESGRIAKAKIAFSQ